MSCSRSANAATFVLSVVVATVPFSDGFAIPKNDAAIRPYLGRNNERISSSRNNMISGANSYLDSLSDSVPVPAPSAGSYLDSLSVNNGATSAASASNGGYAFDTFGAFDNLDLGGGTEGDAQLQPQQTVMAVQYEEAAAEQHDGATSAASDLNGGPALDAFYNHDIGASGGMEGDTQIQPRPAVMAVQEEEPAVMAVQEEEPAVMAVQEEEPAPEQEQQQQQQINDEDFNLWMVSSETQVKLLNGENPYSLTDLDIELLVGRFLDNIEDDAQKKNGKTKGKSRIRLKNEPAQGRPTVVVLGTGWAAHAFVKLASTYDLRIVVVSPVNHFVFTPMLASAAVGTIEYRSMTEPIRVTNPYLDNFVEGRAIGIDVPNKKVKVQLTSLSTVTGAFRGVAANAPCRLEPESVDESSASRVIELNYDYLLCAVGTSARSSIVPGAKEHCFNLKTSQDSKRLRTAIGEALEFASRPDLQESYYADTYMKELAKEERQRRVRFVIVGGGPTGVELAGEMSDFFGQICSKPDGAYQHLTYDISVTLIHGGSELLPAMDQDLRQKALSSLQKQGIQVRLNTRLKEVGQDYVIIGEKGSDEVETIPVGLTIWAAGNAPVPFVQELLSQLPASAAGSAGRINVDRWLRCPTPTPETFGSILVLGDAACLETEHEYRPTEPLPQTAQVAGQQGAFTARMFNRGYDLTQTPPKLPDPDSEEFSLLRAWLQARGLEEAPPFTFLSLGLLAYIGDGKALNQVELGDVPIFNYSGRIAFALWRSVYLTKQAATRNQALIAFDWLRTEAFGRDITRL